MRSSRFAPVPVAALCASALIMLSACAPASSAATPAATPPATASAASSTGSNARAAMIALPRIVVSVDENGVPSVAGISAQLVENLTLGMLPARDVSLDRSWIEYFQSTDVQHIEVLQNDAGVFAWINGRRLPNIAWNGHELDHSAQLADQLGVLETLGLSANASSLLHRSAPVLRRFALNVLVHFPRRPGTAEITVRDASVPVQTLPRQPKTIAERKLFVGVRYDAQGDPWPDGLTDAEFRQRIGFDVMNLALQPELVSRLSARGLRDLVVRSEENGLSLHVNGVSLPALQCDVRCLVDLGDIIATLNTYPQTAHLNAPIRTLTPSLRGIDARLTLQFPTPTPANAVARSSR
jgi:hypothetical protein